MSDGNVEEGATAVKLGRKDFQSDQEVRWCPGCGDYSILAQMKKVMPQLGVARENVVFVSIERATNVASAPMAIESGCSGRSIAPNGVLLGTWPTGLVGEYCPFVRP